MRIRPNIQHELSVPISKTDFPIETGLLRVKKQFDKRIMQTIYYCTSKWRLTACLFTISYGRKEKIEKISF